jgi:predicted O-linked N-acetylglucosamine transferase (SPINDLY family)
MAPGGRREGGGERPSADALIAQGQAEEDAGRLTEAEALFRRAIAAAPDSARAHMNLGNALQKRGRLEDAAAAQRAAIACDAGHAGAHFNLGAVLLAMGDGERAEESFVKALELDPGLADAAVYLAECRSLAGDAEGAYRHLAHAAALAPGHAGIRANLALALIDLGRLEDAASEIERALAAGPGSSVAHAARARVAVLQGHAAAAEADYRAALAASPRVASVWSSWLFSLNLRDDVAAADVAREHFEFGDRIAASVPAARTAARRSRPGRLRVGYVSGDLSAHAIALFLRPVLANHDRSRFETVCYSNSRDEDEVTGELKRSSQAWRVIAGREDEWVERLVREDGIDLLVDLSGHTARNRLTLFARRAAPVQASWLGYLNTTGLRTMDWRICDAYTDPPGETDAFNRERLARLPHAQWCYQPYHAVALPRPRANEGALRFASFNQFVKVSEATLDLWCAILRELPQATLTVHGVPRGVGHADFLGRVARRGVATDRVKLVGRLAILDYFAAIGEADIALDSFPYNGATTTLDTLWMGTPVVALRGERAISRSSYALARAAGLDDLVALTTDEFVRKNLALAADRRERARLRSELRPRLEASPVMDAPRFVRDLESLYESIAQESPHLP